MSVDGTCNDAASRELEEGEIVDDDEEEIQQIANDGNIMEEEDKNTTGQQRIIHPRFTALNDNDDSNCNSNYQNTLKKQREKSLAEIEAKTHKKNTVILVRGLSACSTNPDNLLSHFSQCGRIFNICILHNPSFENHRQTGIHTGIAKISYFDKPSAAAAILNWNGQEWTGGKLHLDWWTKAKNKNILQQSKNWQGKSRQKESENLLENATTSKAADEHQIQMHSPAKIQQIDANTNANASNGTYSFVKQLMAGSPKGKGVFLPKTQRWISPMPSQILAEIDHMNEEDEEEDSELNDECSFSRTMREFSENLPTRNDLETVERVNVMQVLLEGLKLKTQTTLAIIEKEC